MGNRSKARKQAVRRGSGDLGGVRSGGLAEPEAAHAPQAITQLGALCKGLQPLGNRLLLKAVPAPEKVGSLWMPPSAQAEYIICQAEIVACGTAVRDSRLQPGVRVICKRFGSVPLDDAKSVWTVEEGSVLAIV